MLANDANIKQRAAKEKLRLSNGFICETGEKQAERKKKKKVGRGELARKEMSPIRRMTEQIQSQRTRASLLHPSGS